MDEAPGGNPYAPPTAAVEDRGPPTRFVLGCVVLLHSFWCGFLVFFISTRLRQSPPPSPTLKYVLWTLGGVAALYAVTIHRLWRRQRWAWFVCWVPLLGAAILSLFFLYLVLAGEWGSPLTTSDWVLLSFFLVPSALLLPLQWVVRREL